MANFWLDNFLIDDYIVAALKEDMTFGDITTDALCRNLDIPMFQINVTAKEDGVICGLPVFLRVFDIIGNQFKSVNVNLNFKDGDEIKKGDRIASLDGAAKHILSGERVALNFIQRMSGIATATRKLQQILDPYGVSVVDTRKNTPNFRLFEKYAVKVGGHRVHRYNLADCVMLKDNHIALLDGSIKTAVEEVRKTISHAHKIEVECETIEQVVEAINCNVDIIMLDNMSIDLMAECVKVINKKAIVEASGRITLENAEEIAKTGVDIISTSSIVMRAPTLDLSFDYAK